MKRKFGFVLLGFIFSIGTLTTIAQAPRRDSLYKTAPADTLLQRKAAASGSTSADGQTVFQSVEIEASVDINQWRQHLESRLTAPIAKAARKGMRVGMYTVNVRFLVEKDGSISDVRALNDPGYGLAEASEKVVKTGPRWSPGVSDGKIVRSYHTQPITFVISEK